MKAGSIVLVDWRDAVGGTGEPNKLRPAVIVGSEAVYLPEFPFRLVVPLTGSAGARAVAAIPIEPDDCNGCTKVSYALSWCVQAVPDARIRPTVSRVTEDQLAAICSQVAGCLHR